ncbi:hypothetical protein GGR56DRAFT_659869 [Xylariaceae sp. FL0804]|nr:hypothetical protein GGR56DRAFT_659869 [Xylariaceae sp. FL0804]
MCLRLRRRLPSLPILNILVNGLADGRHSNFIRALIASIRHTIYPKRLTLVIKMSSKKVFIIGPGFIGWNVLDLLVAEGYAVTGFVRRKEHAEKIKTSGATDAVLGDLDDKALIAKHVASHDIVFHTATADHLPSVQAVLDGIQQRADKGLSTIYIHTSGTSVICETTPEKVYHDNVPSEINSVPDDAPHREIDLAILAAARRLGPARAKIAIMIPPLIYGHTAGHGRLSIQVPTLTRYALKHGFAGHVGGVGGGAVWSTVHVRDLARAYVALLHHLETTPAEGSPELVESPYYFAENTGDDEVSWREVAELIGESLHAKGLIPDKSPKTIPPETYDDLFGPHTDAVVGLNSRSRAVRLRALGWEPVEKSWKESFLQDELPVILREERG